MSTLLPGRPVLLLLAVAGLGLGALAGAAEAATLNVANNGVDSGTCGAAASPCRSISQAIANASAGDRIVVGPGRYGDLDGDGAFTSAGEEAPSVACSCMIKVDKAVTIESRAGAGATVLDVGGLPGNVVGILASGVVFGRAKKGFTLTGGISGLVVFSGTSGVSVAGNLATANPNYGFYFDGSGHVGSGNAAHASNNGFYLRDSGHTLTGNLASGNVVGFAFEGSGHHLTGNVASANSAYGFSFVGSGHLLSSNVASANDQVGVFAQAGSGHVFSGNAVHGNGVGTAWGGTGTLSKNNLYGNVNCGMNNQSGSAIDARNNFWGAATGPGADPADNVCNFGAGSSTTTAPFSTKESPVKSRPLF